MSSKNNLIDQAKVHFKNRNYQSAKVILEEALAADPNCSQAYEFLAYIAGNSGEADLSHQLLEKACSLNDCTSSALYYLGSSHLGLGNHTQAAVYFEGAIKKQENFFEAYHDLGTTQAYLGHKEAAKNTYIKALSLKQDSPELYYNLARLEDDFRNFEGAIQHYNQSIQLAPNFVAAIINRAIAFKELKKYPEAFASYDLAIKLQPTCADAWSNRGVAFYDLRRYEEALASYEQAIKIQPSHTEAWINKSTVLHDLKRYQEAIEAYKEATRLNQRGSLIDGSLIHLKSAICDWSNFDKDFEYLNQKIADGINVISPFAWLALSDSEQLNLRVAELFTNDQYPKPKIIVPFRQHEDKKKIRLGYYSYDFYNHATAFLMAELFELHNKEKFDITAFSFSPHTSDEMHKRLVNTFDNFIDVNAMTDSQIADLSRKMKIDIAIDLKGHTTNCRTGIFSYKAAPLQVNYLGYPGSMGADFIDYIIADRTLIPPENMPLYSEKIVYLPNSYQVNDRKRKISDKIFSRSELGLPEQGFVFCCFNNNFKINPITFDSWARILHQVPASVLWLLEDNAIAKSNLIKEAKSRGLSEDRLVFAGRLDLPDHLARHRVADLFIDTLPYNAHTTASDALWAGLPVLTLLGKSFAGRVASSLLNAIGMPELITNSQEEYEELAVVLANNPEKLKALKAKLWENRLITPLFNTSLFTKHIETAYEQMYARYQTDMPPEHLYI